MSEQVKKIYSCPICKKQHTVSFDANFAENRKKFPFTYIFLHKFEGQTEDIDLVGSDVLTTLYLDAHLNIRGIETILQDGIGDIISKDDSKEMILKLTNHIFELQAAYDEMCKKYNDLLNSKN